MKMNPSIASFTLTVALAMAATLFTGCGGEKSSDTAAGTAPAAELTPDRSITVTANDQMKFNLAEISAKPGEVLSLTLENVGTMPKFSMGHNLVILKRGVDTQKFCEAAMTQATNDYIPAEMEQSVVAATALLGGGESDTIVFQVPSEKGDYPFVCSFPGHYQVGMRGLLKVQ